MRVDTAWTLHRQAEQRIEHNKLCALAADTADLGLCHRFLQTDEGRSLLRVWEPARISESVTLACANLAEGWSFCHHPFGGVIASAATVNEPGDARWAAQRVAELIRASTP
jgi:hypothetical protein